MIRSRYAWRLFGAAVFLVLASTHVFAVSPSYVVFYGEGLPNPVVLRMSNDTPSEFLWSYARPFKTVNGVRTPTLPGGLEGRTYLNYAVFWGRWPNGPGRPEDASQHGRFYLPTAKAPAAVVITSPDIFSSDSGDVVRFLGRLGTDDHRSRCGKSARSAPSMKKNVKGNRAAHKD